MSLAPTPEDKQRYLQALYDEYQALSNGDKASIRRCVEPDDLLITPAFLRLIGETLGQFNGTERANAAAFFDYLPKIARIVYLLPFAKLNGQSLGEVFNERKISERRLFLVMRSEYPQDLVQLRRLCQQCKDADIDGLNLANLLLYWGKDKAASEGSKRQLMRDFYLSNKQPAEEAVDADY
ncbi:type I-E CRISPR-associated protein Cse2/CasB [Methylomonas koyamae]|uniref:type I-E CRISPR-associated protein Cse2/CasB n=1 Tax=Methylomonas koyamae TaxID=702114 RepID=UPI00112A7D9B|nr:type I-E CRISPR-associated protein Cse2/CasB [Methylomonas koyamae]TPQ24373.1 type I-E CRISPR-associated protein Cse2/CasB [Methylomonas koyamae]